MDQMTDDTSSSSGTAKVAASAAKESAGNVAAEAKQQAGQFSREAMDSARGVLDQALGQARQQTDDQASRAAGGLRTASQQLQALRDGRVDEAGRLGDLAAEAGDRMQQFASRLDDGGWQGMVGDVTRFARRRPGMFLAAAAGVGFVAGRAVRAGKVVRDNDTESTYDYQVDQGGARDLMYTTPAPLTSGSYETAGDYGATGAYESPVSGAYDTPATGTYDAPGADVGTAGNTPLSDPPRGGPLPDPSPTAIDPLVDDPYRSR